MKYFSRQLNHICQKSRGIIQNNTQYDTITCGASHTNQFHNFPWTIQTHTVPCANPSHVIAHYGSNHGTHLKEPRKGNTELFIFWPWNVQTLIHDVEWGFTKNKELLVNHVVQNNSPAKINLGSTENTQYTDCFGIALSSACCSILQVKLILFNCNQQDTIKIKDIDVLTLNKYKKSSAEIESRRAGLSMHRCVLYCVSN